MTILDTMQDPNLFCEDFAGESWNAWRVVLASMFGLPWPGVDGGEALWRECTGLEPGQTPRDCRELWAIVGRQGGKSKVAALLAVYAGCFRDYSWVPRGEWLHVGVVAADRVQADVVMTYIRSMLSVPMLKPLIERETQTEVDLRNHIRIQVKTCNYRTVRGPRYAAVILDEVAHWRDETSSSPDAEVVKAFRPAMSTVRNPLLIAISTAYARRGILWQHFKEHWGQPNDRILLWRASSQRMNPAIDPVVIEDALAADPAHARAEYFSEFRTDVETFVSLPAIEACTVGGRYELPRMEGVRYSGFVDPSGGSSDSMTLAVAHREKDCAVLDALRESPAPFNPDQVTAEFAELLKSYRVSQVTGDRYAGEWPRERFRAHGIAYEVSEPTKSEIYLATLPLLNSGRVELLDHARLVSQLQNLERRTRAGGRDVIDHPPGGHDDVINAAAGALVLATGEVRRDPTVPVAIAHQPLPWGKRAGPDAEEREFMEQMREGRLHFQIGDGRGGS